MSATHSRTRSEASIPRLIRLCQVLAAIGKRKAAVTAKELGEPLEIPRSTFLRDLKFLVDQKFIQREGHGSDVRYVIAREMLSKAPATRMQEHALMLARLALAPLRGTHILKELNALVPEQPVRSGPVPPVKVAAPEPAGRPEVAAVLEEALLRRQRVGFMYRATGASPSERTVDPLGFGVSENQLYLIAYDLDRKGLRTFKIARISSAQNLREPADEHPEYDLDRMFEHSTKVWHGPPVDVVIEIAASVARFVPEWPLRSSQRIEEQPDGSALVYARVAGIVEAKRWVLRWGKNAVVRAPRELREQMKEELRQALSAYEAEPEETPCSGKR